MAPALEPIATRPEPSGCCWEERQVGGGRVVQCGAEVMVGRPWCAVHWLRWQRGKQLAGRSRLSPTAS
jgi:hypothetical protein